MPHDPEKYLYDIHSSADFLLEFTAGKTVEDYSQDRAFRSAIERELQVIGEAVMQLERVAPVVASRCWTIRIPAVAPIATSTGIGMSCLFIRTRG